MTSTRSASPARPSAEARTFIEDLGAFVTASPSSYHAAAEAARRLDEAGFSRLEETEDWADASAVTGAKYVVRDGAIIAWVTPGDVSPATAWRILGAHTDSPAFKVKPKPSIEAEGFAQVGVEVYGGPLLNSWLDRDLRLAGRLVLDDGSVHLVQTGPVLRLPQLAVHLDRGVNAEGLKLDPQRHLQPVIGLGEVDVVGLLGEAAGVDPERIRGMEVVTVDTQTPAVIGAHEELFASARLDNLVSTHGGVRAIIEVAEATPSSGPIALFVANDHEEVGSSTRSGAGGPFLEDVLVRMHAALGGDDSSRRRACAASMVLSCDTGHAAHPNYPERHDPANRPRLGAGPLLGVDLQQRYATDAIGAAAFAAACEQAEVPFQEFVSNNAMPCGSTIGPITATRLGITTVDCGVALLSMHSTRELCAVADPLLLEKASVAFLTPVV